MSHAAELSRRRESRYTAVKAETVDNSLLLEVLKDIQKQLAEQRTLLLQSIERSRRLEQHMDTQLIAINQRLSGLKDDVELMLKAELMGSLANFETRIEHLIERRPRPHPVG